MSEAYRRAGVDLDAAARAVDHIRELAADASRPEVVEGIGGFAGLFRIDDRRLLAAATDGVGTKVEVARMAGRLEGLGVDLVAMCANDLICSGAEPLFFLDYVAVGRLDPREVAVLVEGVAEGCRRAGCALLGGETAEHPGVLEPGRFDLAGFCVGVVEERSLLGPARVGEGDLLIGVPSSGVHANGFSLIRMALRDGNVDLASTPPVLGRSVADELLEPTAIYVRGVLDAVRAGSVKAAAHVTGGGIVENVPRALPEGLGAELRTDSWEVPPVFAWLEDLAKVGEDEMYRTFNMGLGMVLVAAEELGAAAAEAVGEGARVVGRVTSGRGVTLV